MMQNHWRSTQNQPWLLLASPECQAGLRHLLVVLDRAVREQEQVIDRAAFISAVAVQLRKVLLMVDMCMPPLTWSILASR